MTSSLALLGVPADWTDENEWYWDLFVWKRRPRFRTHALRDWVSGAADREPLADIEPSETGVHSYLFSRAGGPASIQPVLVARPWLVAGFSGSVLLIGLILLARRPPAMLVLVVALVAVLALGAAVESSLLLLGLQTSAFGLALVAVAAILQRSLARRPITAPVVGDRARDSAREFPGSVSPPTAAPDFAGSDGSTVIRPRPGTTVDHVRKADSPIPEPLEERGRSI